MRALPSPLSDNSVLRALPGYIEPIGTLWVNALRMIVIPLVVSAILLGVTSLPDARTIGRIGGRAILLFLVVLSAAAVFAVLVAPPVFALLPIDAAAAQTLRENAAAASGAAVESANRITGVRQWLIDLVPTNPIRAAADGSMLPLIVFTLLFGLGLNRASPANRETFMQGVNAGDVGIAHGGALGAGACASGCLCHQHRPGHAARSGRSRRGDLLHRDRQPDVRGLHGAALHPRLHAGQTATALVCARHCTGSGRGLQCALLTGSVAGFAGRQ